MSYHTLLVQVDEDPFLDLRLATARQLARRFAAHVVGLHAKPLPVVPVGYGEAAAYVGSELIEVQRRLLDERAERLGRRFRERLRDLAPDISWRVEEGTAAERLVEAARTADLSLVLRGEEHRLDLLEPDPAEELALGAGGPVLILPRNEWEVDPGRRVLLAWNGSRQACRAVHDALGFLATAQEVRMLAIGEDAAGSLADAGLMLERHGVGAELSRHPLGHGTAGEVLLEQARAFEADLVVMGAYGHSRLRELILGGTTRHVLTHATVPVLVAS